MKRSRPFPKGSRKINIDGQIWHWYDNGGYDTVIWDPQANKHVISKSNFVVGSCGYGSQWNKDPTMPADIRRFIEIHLLKKDVPIFLDPKAISGRLYAYREKHIDSAPQIRIWNVWGGASVIKSDLASPGYYLYNAVREYLKEQKPFVYLKGYTDQKAKNAYYEILAGDIVATILIPYPRTWSGSFKETTLEWQKENNK